MRRNRNAKIVATLGPASSSETDDPHAVRGPALNVFGSISSHAHGPTSTGARCEMARRIGREFGRPGRDSWRTCKGPSCGSGASPGGAVELQPGEPFRLDLNPAKATPGA